MHLKKLRGLKKMTNKEIAEEIVNFHIKDCGLHCYSTLKKKITEALDAQTVHISDEEIENYSLQYSCKIIRMDLVPALWGEDADDVQSVYRDGIEYGFIACAKWYRNELEKRMK